MRHDPLAIAYMAGFAVGAAIRVVHTRHCISDRIARSQRTRADTLLVLLASLGVLAPLPYVFTSWLDFADYRAPGWTGVLGTAVFAAALWLLWKSHVDLGRNWSAALGIRDHHTLVTSGSYGRIRHPMYAAHWLWGVAQALLLHNWLVGPALLVTFAPLYVIRVPREEDMMLERFGEAYRKYMRRTPRLTPWPWRGGG